jgi:hypothetical protein
MIKNFFARTATIILIINLALLCRPAAPGQTAAPDNGVIISPTIIDAKVSARDILERVIKIKNTKSYMVELYPFVNDVSQAEGKLEFIDPSFLDEATSSARWLEISRGVISLMPDQEIAVPLKINVSLRALPGKYYSVITFAEGGNRPLAEEAINNSNQPQLMVNLEVQEHIVEKAESVLFKTETNFNFSNPVNFSLDIKNIGNKELIPKGAIVIYDRNDNEVNTLDFNNELTAIAANEIKNWHFAWDGGSRFGKFKAKLEIEYGNNSQRDLQDSIYFWILPVWFLGILGLLLIILLTSFILLAKRFLHYQKHYFHNQPNGREVIINLKSKPKL